MQERMAEAEKREGEERDGRQHRSVTISGMAGAGEQAVSFQVVPSARAAAVHAAMVPPHCRQRQRHRQPVACHHLPPIQRSALVPLARERRGAVYRDAVLGLISSKRCSVSVLDGSVKQHPANYSAACLPRGNAVAKGCDALGP